jgi:hypothetical protein
MSKGHNGPRRVPNIELEPIAEGFMAYDAEASRVHYLNRTAGIVLQLCDGETTAETIAATMQDIYSLSEPPSGEVASCLQSLREDGLLSRAAAPSAQQSPRFLAPAPDRDIHQRYVRSIRGTGIGDRLICLCAAWIFAHSTGRILIADWRFGAYSAPNSGNIFSRCFEQGEELAGVPFVGDQSVSAMAMPRPRHPAAWNDDRLLAFPFLRSPHTIFEDRDAAVALIRSGADVAEPVVVFDSCINDGVVSIADARRFLRALQPVETVTSGVRAFQQRHGGRRPMIGLHMRHGNGGEIMGHAPYWVSFDDAIERCAQAVAAARKSLGADTAVFLCTDSQDVEVAVRHRIGAVVTRDKTFRESGQGELHLGRDSGDSLHDALVEMILLADCDALVRYPPGSFFTFYSAVLMQTRQQSGGTIYDLQKSYDSADRLSPALLL